VTCGFGRAAAWCDGSSELRDQPESSCCCGRSNTFRDRPTGGLGIELLRSIRGFSDPLVRGGSSVLGADGRHRDGSDSVARNACSARPREFSAPTGSIRPDRARCPARPRQHDSGGSRRTGDPSHHARRSGKAAGQRSGRVFGTHRFPAPKSSGFGPMIAPDTPAYFGLPARCHGSIAPSFGLSSFEPTARSPS
jgi:hypothetical protein